MKRFSIQQIKYGWVLLISIVIFFTAYLLDLLSLRGSSEGPFVMGYVVATLVAAVWAILNYVDHLKVNPLYQKDDGGHSEAHAIFQYIPHQYLLFWGSILVLVGMLFFIVQYAVPSFRSPWGMAIGVTTAFYGFGFYLSFFMYNVLNKLFCRK